MLYSSRAFACSSVAVGGGDVGAIVGVLGVVGGCGGCGRWVGGLGLAGCVVGLAALSSLRGAEVRRCGKVREVWKVGCRTERSRVRQQGCGGGGGMAASIVFVQRM